MDCDAPSDDRMSAEEAVFVLLRHRHTCPRSDLAERVVGADPTLDALTSNLLRRERGRQQIIIAE